MILSRVGVEEAAPGEEEEAKNVEMKDSFRPYCTF
jgi:hypothetical protein